KMKDTAPISEGIIAVSALFGIIAAGVAYVLYEFGLAGSVFIGGGVALVAAIVLALGWRAPAEKPGSAKIEAAPAPTAPAPAPVAPAPEPVAEPAPVAAPEPVAAPASPAEPAEAAKPTFLDAAREGGPDDLKQIKGVGPKLEKTLHGMGIFHFDQISTWGPAEQAWMDDNLEGFKGRATRDDWVGQAKTLAAGGETAFSKKVEDGDVY
ncbi:MAG: NADH:ubiquinone oxidoreductase, partial [Pseudomonadota bacterium]